MQYATMYFFLATMCFLFTNWFICSLFCAWKY